MKKSRKCLIFNKINLLFIRLFYYICFLFPICKTKICISSFYGVNCSGDPFFIGESLKGKGFEIICGIDPKACSGDLDSEYKKVNIHSFLWIFHKMTSAVWIDNCRTDSYAKKKKTLYINTWHGGSSIKKIEKDAPKLSDSYKRKAKRDSKFVDFFVSNSKEMTELIKKSFWYDGNILMVGNPRNDVLKKDYQQPFLNSIKEKLGIDINSKVVLYCPTFRDETKLPLYNLDYERIEKALSPTNPEGATFLIRLHPNLKSKGYDASFNKAIDVSNYDCIQDLFLISDILISDFSSVLYDFSYTKKYAIRYIPDLNEYMDERGLYHPLDFYPWPIAKNIDELISLLFRNNLDEYLLKLKSYKCNIGEYNDILSTDIICELICSFLNNKLDKNLLMKKYNQFIC